MKPRNLTMLVCISLILIACGIKPTPTIAPIAAMYACGIDRCRNSGSYGQRVAESGINIWNHPDPDRQGIHHQIWHTKRVEIIGKTHINLDPGGTWYQLQEGGWISDLWLTETQCTRENLEQYTIPDC